MDDLKVIYNSIRMIMQLWIKLRKLKRLWVLSPPMNHAKIGGYLNTVRTGTAMC